jgi:hypothetical protein
MSSKNSIINKISKEELLNLFNNSSSFKEILSNLGLDNYSGGNYRTLKKRLAIENIDLLSLSKRRSQAISQKRQKTRYTFEEIFKKDSKCKSGNKILKKIILRNKILEHCCGICKIEPVWNGKPLILQVDHIDGDSSNNEIKNLRLVCPNCHSQTDTYCGKLKKKKYITDKINVDILRKLLDTNTIENVKKILKISNNQLKNLIFDNGISYVKKKSFYDNKKKFEVSKEELQDLVNKESFLRIGRKFGVSDNSIRKRCRRLGIEVPKGRRGFWSKVYAGKINL